MCLLSCSQLPLQILLVPAHELNTRLQSVGYTVVRGTQAESIRAKYIHLYTYTHIYTYMYMFCWRMELARPKESNILNQKSKATRGKRRGSRRWVSLDQRARSPRPLLCSPGVPLLPLCAGYSFLSRSSTLWKGCWPWWAMGSYHQ